MTQNLTFEQLPEAVTMLANEVSELKRLLVQKQQSTEPQNALISIDQAAELLQLTKPTIYSKHSKGELPGVCKVGKKLFFEKDVLINWIKEGRKLSNSEIAAAADNYLTSTKKGL
jgi:excisionase family DNA binding protein